MRADEIREMAPQDIAARVRELEEERFRLQFRSATEPLEDPLRLRALRRDIARLKTVLRQKAAPAAKTAAGESAAAPTAAPRGAKKAATRKVAAKKSTRAAR